MGTGSGLLLHLARQSGYDVGTDLSKHVSETLPVKAASACIMALQIKFERTYDVITMLRA